MRAIVERHLKAEGAGDVEGAVAVYTDDVIHDAVGFPGSPRQGKDAAREFYAFLTANFRTEGEEPLHQFVSDDALFPEQLMTGRVIGEIGDWG
ncbi:MAG: nuclear transport factor 2 family protein [Actinomycetota bacterium]|nr:nuclear transport factor 2 family protein [Actinomycetota bacterium]